MRILVTGGAGFIGSNFVHQILRDHPSDHLVIVDKLTYAGNLRNLEGPLLDARVQFVRLDISDPAIAELAKNCDAVIHFAADSHVDRSIEDATPFVRTNVEGTWRLIDTCRAAKVCRFVHVSTDEVYGSLGAGEQATESAPLAPSSPYAASKAASDLMVLSAIKTHNFPAVITRCTNNYGPFQFPEKFIPLMISQALANQPLPVYGDGRNVRDWIHVSDHCRALDLILRSGKEGEVYNIGGGYALENITVALKILKALARPERLVEFVADRPAHDRRYAVDCKKLRTDLAWKPNCEFDRGLAETIRWYQENSTWLEETRNGAYQKYFERHYVRRGETFSPSIKNSI
ncbi:MAG: dTDP-glucose 4,6-dehydratase [Candidatus Acidiferrum sp.]